nr:immunoglobulin light chain junction region [Macaca mulatta]MOY06371.1 immunoglobulin light chain junction region [Macaca mulatta]MOY09550.1 immunoglobulin light chain junction region [Macaca mulatta]
DYYCMIWRNNAWVF